MAQARKAPLRPAPAAKPGAAKPVKPPTATPAKDSATGTGLRMALGILLLALVTGAVPLALAGQVLGYWRLPLTMPALPFLPSAVVYDAQLATAQPMVTNATIHVMSAPGASVSIATLEPGFPVQVDALRHGGRRALGANPLDRPHESGGRLRLGAGRTTANARRERHPAHRRSGRAGASGRHRRPARRGRASPRRSTSPSRTTPIARPAPHRPSRSASRSSPSSWWLTMDWASPLNSPVRYLRAWCLATPGR